jgi:hypothetical protein
MPLITSIQEVKAVLRIASVDSDSSLPDMKEAEYNHIIPRIGKELYNELLVAYEGDTLTTIQEDLLLYIQKPLAAFAYYDGLAMQHAMITDAGVRRTSSDNIPSAYRWEFDGVKETLALKAHQGMEALLDWLEDNKASFPTYTASEAYTKRNQYLIKSAKDFDDVYRIAQKNRTYFALLNIMDDVERMYVLPLIGEDFFAELKAETAPSNLEKGVILFLKKAIAQFTLYHAFEKNAVKMTEQGPSIYDRYADRGGSDQAQPSPDMMRFTMDALQRDGQTWLKQARKVLNANASDTVFTTYYNSDFYTSPDVEPVDHNKDRGFFTFIR